MAIPLQSFRGAAALTALLAFTPVAGRSQLAQDQRSAPANAPATPHRVAARTAESPAIDGVLDDAVWSDAPLFSGFVQREPVEGAPVSERTEVRVLYDSRAIYIGAWLYDREPGGIVSGEARRDADIGDADAIVFIIDTYLDRQNGFVFGTTPAGIEYDGQVTREGEGGAGANMRQQSGAGGGFNKNWDGSWQVATSRDADGWYAEFRIPFSTLRYDGAGLQTWGINVARRIRRRNEESFWAPIPRQHDLYRVSQAGMLELETPVTRSLAITPYMLVSGRRDYAAGTRTTRDLDAGFDAKLGLSSSLSLDLTLNTDFAQVEVDEEEINLTRFRLFFPEKRPFFLENAGTFAVGSPQEVELFFSRSIGIADGAAVPILGGGRLTGRVGRWTVGLLDIQTERLVRPGDDAAVITPANNYSVARVLRELPNRTRVGATLVNRFATGSSDDRNHAYGIDARVGVGEALTFEGYLAGTHTPDVDGPAYAASIDAGYNDADWSAGASYREVQRGFQPDVGFLARSEYRFVTARVLRRVRLDDVAWFRELRPHASYREYFDLHGFTTTRLVHVDNHFVFANGAFFQLPAFNYTREGLREPFEIAPGVIVPAGSYDNIEFGFVGYTDQSARVSFRSAIDIGGFYSGRRAGTSSTLNVRFNDAFNISLRGTWYDVRLAEGDFRTSALRFRASYAFTPKLYLQSLLQYNDQTKSFSSNVRLGWLATAGTGLFVVFNNIEQLSPLERLNLESGLQERGLTIKFTRQFDVR
ncbi:MAG: DUF5916 domain-containing protein [Gemmatimonadota bacterium]